MKSDTEINGKTYALWPQFVARKQQFIGGTLQELSSGFPETGFAETTITEIKFEPSGEDSAMFEVEGKRFSCSFNVKYGGVTGGEEGWITFSGYGGHTWRIRPPDGTPFVPSWLSDETPIASRESVPTVQMKSTESSLQELRVRVAELCGARWFAVYEPSIAQSAWPKRVLSFKKPEFKRSVMPIAGASGDAFWHNIPDYCADLNACAELIDVLAERGWTCVMNQPEGRGRSWRCAFNRYEDGIGYSYAKHASRLAVAVCKAFVAVMEASDRPGADSVSDVTKSDDASRASSPKDSLSPEIVIPAPCKAVRRAGDALELIKKQQIIGVSNEAQWAQEAIASILEKKDA